MKTKIVIIVAVLAAVAALALVINASLKNTSQDQAAIEQLPEGAFGKIQDFRYTRTVKGRREFEVEAESATYFDLGKRADFLKAKVTFFGEDGARISLLADKGLFFTDTKNVEVSGHVVVKSSHGYRVATESLRYDAQQRVITGDEPVMITSEDLSLTAVGMDLSVTEHKLRLHNSVRAAVYQ